MLCARFREEESIDDALEGLVDMCKRTKEKYVMLIIDDVAVAFNMWWCYVLVILKARVMYMLF